MNPELTLQIFQRTNEKTQIDAVSHFRCMTYVRYSLSIINFEIFENDVSCLAGGTTKDDFELLKNFNFTNKAVKIAG